MPENPAPTTPAAAEDRARLAEQVRALAVVHGEVTLASGRTADYYVDMRRVTLDGATAPLIGRVMLDAGRRLGVRGRRRPDAGR